MRIAILGLGREGNSILRFLKKNGPYKNADVWIVDKKATIKLPRGVRGRFGRNYLKNLDQFDLVFRSPGIPYNLPELKRARRAGTKFSSATKLFFDLARRQTQTARRQTQKLVGVSPRSVSVSQRPTIIGITGTKGKGTTATLLYKILKAAHKPVLLAGNIGKPALDLLPYLSASSPRKSTLVILELSSFQLQDLEKSPNVAVVLDIFPDHQDSHLNLREYYEAKTNIARHQSASRRTGDKIFFFQNHPLSKWVASKSRGKKIAVDTFDKLGAGETKLKLFKPADLTMPGFHNFKNAVMAAAVAKALGVPDRTIIKTVKNFRGIEHRLELVRAMRVPRGLTRKNTRTNAERGLRKSAYSQRKSAIIDFYNDSASTNPHTTAAAIKAFPNNAKILIAGGLDKGLNYKPLARALKNSDTKLIILLGENKKKIQKAIKKSGIKTKLADNLKAAVKTAYKFALKLPTAYCLLPTIILFSPGAASFDMFKNYADRGGQFKKIVKSLQ